MNRRKLETGTSSRRGTWLGQRQVGRSEKPGSSDGAHDKSPEDNSSFTAPSTWGSSCNGLADYDLPNWENPISGDHSATKANHAVIPSKNRSPIPLSKSMRESREAHQSGVNGTAAQQFEQNESLENLVVVCNSSMTSFADDITYLEDSFSDLVEDCRTPLSRTDYRRGTGFSTGRTQSHQKPIPGLRESKPHGAYSVPSSASLKKEEADEDQSIAEQVQEEEMIRLAMERSLADSRSRQPHPYQPRSPKRHSSLPIVGTNAAGEKFMWKKGPNGRYFKVPIEFSGLQEDNDRAPNERRERTSFSSCPDPESSEDRLSRIEQDMLEEAMERSLQDASSVSRSIREEDSVDYDAAREEQELEEAIRRSKEEAQLNIGVQERQKIYLTSCSEHSGSSGGGDDRVGFLHRPPQQSLERSRPCGTRKGGSWSKNYVWKKGPNNKYIKCPIRMDQLGEEEVYGEKEEPSLHDDTVHRSNMTVDQDEVSEERMEEYMLQEAMRRSMQDLNTSDGSFNW